MILISNRKTITNKADMFGFIYDVEPGCDSDIISEIESDVRCVRSITFGIGQKGILTQTILFNKLVTKRRAIRAVERYLNNKFDENYLNNEYQFLKEHGDIDKESSYFCIGDVLGDIYLKSIKKLSYGDYMLVYGKTKY